jgi:general stress protein YciG
MAKKTETDKPKGSMSVREAGRKGGERTAERHGPQFYEEIGRKGGQKVKELIEQGKRTEQP